MNEMIRFWLTDLYEREIEVIYNDIDGVENVGYRSGNTKAEAWVDFFVNYSDISFDMITDYSFC